MHWDNPATFIDHGVPKRIRNIIYHLTRKIPEGNRLIVVNFSGLIAHSILIIIYTIVLGAFFAFCPIGFTAMVIAWFYIICKRKI